jgi:ankyrin repeat protein
MNNWQWDSGVSHFRVEYTAPADATNKPSTRGKLTWIEEVSPEDDERGNGSHLESEQTLTAFQAKGPHNSPPIEIVTAMLTALTDFPQKKPLWYDPYRLIKATVAQDRAAVQAILDEGVPSDMPVNGFTPVYWAVRYQDYELTELLLSRGVLVNRHFPGSDETLLMTLCMYAPDATWEAIAARIIAQGADLEERQLWGETALMAAASASSRLPGLIGLLLAAGADVNARSTHGYTALMQTVTRRYAPVAPVRELLAAGADVNTRDKEGMSPLMWAISCELVESVQCLLEAGADVQAVSAPKQKYREPKSVLQFAIDYANPEIIALVRAAWGEGCESREEG